MFNECPDEGLKVSTDDVNIPHCPKLDNKLFIFMLNHKMNKLLNYVISRNAFPVGYNIDLKISDVKTAT